MKNLVTKISITGLILMLAIACKSGNNATNNDSEKYTIEYNLPQGETLKQIVSMESRTTQKLMGQEMESVIIMTMSSSFNVKGTDADNYLVDMTYDAIRMDVSVMGNSVSFDSNTDEEKAFGQNLSPVFKAMTNIPIDLKINRQGKVELVNGYDKILDAMSDAASELDETTKKAMFQEFDNQFSDKAIKEMFEKTVMYFPPNPVAIGETWNIKTQITQSFPIDVDMELTLTDVKDNVAIIEGTGNVSTNASQKMNGIQATITLKGTQTATIEIDTKTGWVINANVEQNLKGAMGTKMPQTSVNIVKITDK